MTIQVDRDDRAGPRSYLAFDRSHIDVKGFLVAIDKNRCRTAIANGVRGRDKRQRWHNHLVTRTDAQSNQCKMNCCCAVVGCNRVLYFTKLGESFLKSGQILADRRDPARVHTVRHVALLGFSDHRERHADLSDRSLSIVHELVRSPFWLLTQMLRWRTALLLLAERPGTRAPA